LLALTPVAAGLAVAKVSGQADAWRARMRDAGAAAATAGLVMFVLAWQGGGAIGGGRLRTVGASPWQVGLFVAAEIALVAATALVIAWGGERLREASARDQPWAPGATLAMVSTDEAGDAEVDANRGGRLAG
jgi:hypothetical protein